MNRYNIFHKVHKGLRALLYDTNMLLQQTDFTMEEEAKEAVGRIVSVVYLFRHFRRSEDVLVLPAMICFEPSVTDAFEQEHEEGFQKEEKIERLVEAFNRAVLPLEKLSFGNELTLQLEEYTLFSILHMTREEQVVNKILWRYYSDPELQRLGWKIIHDADSVFALPYNKWMIRGLNNNEIIRWLKEVKVAAKEMEFQSLLKTAEAELQPQRWNLLHDVLSAGAFLAN